MHISAAGLKLIEQFEGFSSAPYWDAYGRVWTRGYGETEGIGAGSPHISQPDGETHLRQLIEQRYEWAIRQLNVELNQHQWDALCSFIWNLGPGIFAGQLRAALQAKHWQEAANLMLLYDHAGGVRLEGLTRRRREEAQLFLRAATPAEYVPSDEARWEHEYDHLQHVGWWRAWARTRRRVLRRVMTARRREIVRRAAQDGWDKLNRTKRYWKLWARTET